MAGHSKWANIQYRKKAQDAKRGKLFTRLIREITVASRCGSPNPNDNPRLRLAVDRAMAANMGKDTIARAIKRGSGELEGQVYDTVCYEGYGAGGVAILVECLTDNRNRSVAEVRYIFGKHGGSLGEAGSVSYLFAPCAVVTVNDGDEDKLMETALEAGADDIVTEDGVAQLLTAPDDLLKLKEAVEAAGFSVQGFELEMRAQSRVEVNEDDSEKLVHLLDALENLDDVQNVYCNARFA